MLFPTSKKLLIGVSSPVGYFYARASEKGRPAPVLETPTSYCLLYDEVWFFSRLICPYNMEGLSFVHFVDEELQPKGLPKDVIPHEKRGAMGPFPWEEWTRVIDATIGSRWNYDNHSRSLKFGEFELLPTPGRYENLLIDRFIAAEYGMDLVENTANAIWSQQMDEESLHMQLSEHVLHAKIKSLQTMDGPWLPVIEELRNNSHLQSYRARIGAVSDLKELPELEAKIEELSDEQERMLVRHSEERTDLDGNVTNDGTKFLVGSLPAVGTAMSGVMLAHAVIEQLRTSARESWVTFVGQARLDMKDARKGEARD